MNPHFRTISSSSDSSSSDAASSNIEFAMSSPSSSAPFSPPPRVHLHPATPDGTPAHNCHSCGAEQIRGRQRASSIAVSDDPYQKLLSNNARWAADKMRKDPNYFIDLAKGQKPHYLLIGCSDSRAPPDQLTQTQPGDIFIHRNVANVVVHTDMNLMAVLQYAVEVLQVRYVIVMGHYGCGGVRAALENKSHGLIDKWLRNIKDIYRLHRHELTAIADEDERLRRMVELNVIEAVFNLRKTSILQRAWDQGQVVSVHGWVYDIYVGRIRDLHVENHPDWADIEDIYRIDFPHDDITPPPTLATSPAMMGEQEMLADPALVEIMKQHQDSLLASSVPTTPSPSSSSFISAAAAPSSSSSASRSSLSASMNSLSVSIPESSSSSTGAPSSAAARAAVAAAAASGGKQEIYESISGSPLHHHPHHHPHHNHSRSPKLVPRTPILPSANCEHLAHIPPPPLSLLKRIQSGEFFDELDKEGL